MCKKTDYEVCNVRIDKCIRPLIKWLLKKGFAPVASCCGHGKYPITVVVRSLESGKFSFYELFTDKLIPRKRKFYKKDKQGHYFIPEVSKEITTKPHNRFRLVVGAGSEDGQ